MTSWPVLWTRATSAPSFARFSAIPPRAHPSGRCEQAATCRLIAQVAAGRSWGWRLPSSCHRRPRPAPFSRVRTGRSVRGAELLRLKSSDWGTFQLYGAPTRESAESLEGRTWCTPCSVTREAPCLLPNEKYAEFRMSRDMCRTPSLPSGASPADLRAACKPCAPRATPRAAS